MEKRLEQIKEDALVGIQETLSKIEFSQDPIDIEAMFFVARDVADKAYRFYHNANCKDIGCKHSFPNTVKS